jgi:hypothetical protein
MRLPPIKLSARRRAPLDAASDAYVQWRRECVVVRDAYRVRICGAAAYDPPRFAAYPAALNRKGRQPRWYGDLEAQINGDALGPARRAALSAAKPWARSRPDVDVIRRYSTGA